MLKKTGVVAAAAAGLMLMGAPAFATTTHEPPSSTTTDVISSPTQIGLVNIGDINILHNVVLLPILSSVSITGDNAN